jgi:organic hydroperoxide reductase OsmC/OhrA
MHRYTAVIEWERGEQTFTDNRYSRRHVLRFDGGAVIPGSSSPLVVRTPMSDPAAVDPEELFVAALSNCHMLWFLDLARRAGYRVDRYVDNAEGFMENDAEGRMAITRVVLHPEVVFSGEKLPRRADLEQVHHRAHEECYIANSVKTNVTIEPVWRQG